MIWEILSIFSRPVDRMWPAGRSLPTSDLVVVKRKISYGPSGDHWGFLNFKDQYLKASRFL